MTLTQLGNKVETPKSPNDAVIETIETDPEALYVSRFVCPEFTSLCPITGQPDFAELLIDYIPAERLIESKSLKLFLGSFRNHGGFHETTTALIGKRLAEACDPVYLRITAFWKARGGIYIDVIWDTEKPPEGVVLPDNSYAVLRARK